MPEPVSGATSPSSPNGLNPTADGIRQAISILPAIVNALAGGSQATNRTRSTPQSVVADMLPKVASNRYSAETGARSIQNRYQNSPDQLKEAVTALTTASQQGGPNGQAAQAILNHLGQPAQTAQQPSSR